ncbi:hypothetical protein HZS_1415, partial [Henneguya salminicola]
MNFFLHISVQNLLYFPRDIISGRHLRWNKKQSVSILFMSEFCDFQEFIDQALRDQFIIGFRDAKNNIRAFLLAETDLSFKRTVE